MKVPVEKLEYLFNRFHNTLTSVNIFGDLELNGRKFTSGSLITEGDLHFLRENGIELVEVISTERFYSLLSDEFNTVYRKPFGFMNFFDMDKHLENLQNINMQSKRKRSILLIGDIYGIDSTNGKRIILATHNEEMDYKKWSAMKRYIEKDQKFYYRNSENIIILFVNMQPEAESSYVERFKKNTDLVAALVSRKRDTRVTIAPDFIPTEDVISVNDPSLLLDVYVKTNARLIIIGESISNSYKNSLLRVRQYDKFVRMMVVPALDTRNLNHFLAQVKLVYHSNRWEI